jgi:hypothetical protein
MKKLFFVAALAVSTAAYSQESPSCKEQYESFVVMISIREVCPLDAETLKKIDLYAYRAKRDCGKELTEPVRSSIAKKTFPIMKKLYKDYGKDQFCSTLSSKIQNSP